MALLDVVIQVLNIDCGVVQCSGYASEVEALFYVLFFPTVFIILFVYIVTGAIINKVGGAQGAFRILISVALYAFIIFEGYYNLFAALASAWWLLLATLVGLWLFIRQIIHGGGQQGSAYRGFDGGLMGKTKERVLKRASGGKKKMEKELNAELKNMEATVDMMEDPPAQTSFEGLMNTYKSQKRAYFSVLRKYTDLGFIKFEFGGQDFDISKMDDPWIDKVNNLDDKVVEIGKKHKLKLNKKDL
jgi:hypothetical protein